MSLIRIITSLFSRPIARLAMVVGTIVIGAGSAAQAGVIRHWANESPAVLFDWTQADCGMSAESDLAGAKYSAPTDGEEDFDQDSPIVDYTEADGGASAPVNCATGTTSLLLAATFDLPVVNRLAGRASRHLRESSLLFSQPPQGELLDPPKG